MVCIKQFVSYTFHLVLSCVATEQLSVVFLTQGEHSLFVLPVQTTSAGVNGVKGEQQDVFSGS